MCIIDFLNPSLLVILTFIVGATNLLIPFVINQGQARNYLLCFVSLSFFFNVLILDYLFLKGVRVNFILFNLGKFPIAFHFEPLGLIFLSLLSVLWIAALFYSIGYLKVNDIHNKGRFLFFLNLCLLLGGAIALSANLFTMFISYEFLSLATLPLIAHEVGQKTIKGVYNYFKVLFITSMLLFFPATLYIYFKSGHGNFIALGFLKDTYTNKESIILLLMFIFGISKAALFPFHTWLPAAMIASYPVSALLHAVVVVKAGLFCIFKILIYVFGLNFLKSLFPGFNWIIIFPAFTILYSAFKALHEDNIKMLLAYSTINQLSMALISSFMFTSKAMGAAILHMISHSFSKICLFYGAGIIYSLRKSNQIEDLRGAFKEMPVICFIFLLASLSLIGIPPLSGFISKFYILLAATREENYLVTITIFISTIITALYMFKLIMLLYSPKNRDLIPIETEGPKINTTLPLGLFFSLIFCCFGVVFFFFITRLLNCFLEYL